MTTIALLLLLYFSPVSEATTKSLRQGGQAQTAFDCEIHSKFQEPKCLRISGGPGKEDRFENALFWEVEVLERTGARCPQGAPLSLRIRAAECGGVSPIAYPVDIVEPRSGELAKFKIKFVEGRNTYLNREFSEWIYIERKND